MSAFCTGDRSVAWEAVQALQTAEEYALSAVPSSWFWHKDGYEEQHIEACCKISADICRVLKHTFECWVLVKFCFVR